MSAPVDARRLFEARFRWVVLEGLRRFDDKLDLGSLDEISAAHDTFVEKALELAAAEGLDPMQLDVVQTESLLAALVAQVAARSSESAILGSAWLESIPWQDVMQGAKDGRVALEKKVAADRSRAAAGRPNIEARDLKASAQGVGKIELACAVSIDALVDGFRVTGARVNGVELAVESFGVSAVSEGQRQLKVVVKWERELGGTLDVTLLIDDHGQPRTVHAFGVA